MKKTQSDLRTVDCSYLEERDYVKKSSFMPRLPERFCPNKFFGRKKRSLFGEHFSFNLFQNWMPANLA